MVTTEVKVNIAEPGDQGQLIVPPEVLSEMGVERGDKLTLEVVAGTLVIRGESGLAQAKGAGAPWRRIPSPTAEEENEAFEWAVAEDNAKYE
jgi:bifunctional DNA-binding transcriptional regulator/antitoxin component of YhaV-PrlF toxin-antitoxin module